MIRIPQPLMRTINVVNETARYRTDHYFAGDTNLKFRDQIQQPNLRKRLLVNCLINSDIKSDNVLLKANLAQRKSVNGDYA